MTVLLPWNFRSRSVSTVVDILVVAQRQIPGSAHCEKTVDFPQVQVFGLVFDVR